jgi:hypothetical protein
MGTNIETILQLNVIETFYTEGSYSLPSFLRYGSAMPPNVFSQNTSMLS